MKADSNNTTRCPPQHPEPSAAYVARERCSEICNDLDAMRRRQPIAARVCEALLLRELAGRAAPILLELMADAASEPDLLGNRHGEGAA